MVNVRQSPSLDLDRFLSGIYRKSRWEYHLSTGLRVERLGMSRTHHNA
jgi:hypothetical protein